MKSYITTIAKKEGVKLIPEGLDAVFEASGGDMRKATNLLQAAAATQGEVDDIAIYSVLGKVSPQRVRDMINLGMKGEFLDAREILRSLLIDEGLGAEDVLRMIYSELMRMQMPEKWKVRISDTVGEVDFRLTQGARPEIQLSTLIAKLALASEEIEHR